MDIFPLSFMHLSSFSPLCRWEALSPLSPLSLCLSFRPKWNIDGSIIVLFCFAQTNLMLGSQNVAIINEGCAFKRFIWVTAAWKPGSCPPTCLPLQRLGILCLYCNLQLTTEIIQYYYSFCICCTPSNYCLIPHFRLKSQEMIIPFLFIVFLFSRGFF